MFFKKKVQYMPDMKRDKALEYLKEKYNEEFVIELMNEEQWGQAHDELYAYPKNGTTDDMFTVYGSAKKNGTYEMHDSYFKIIIKDEYEAVMSSFVSEIYGEFKLCTYFRVGSLPDRLNKNTKINEIYNKDEHFTSDTIVFVRQAENIDVSESLKKIAQRMVENKLVGEIRIYEVFEDKYDQITDKASEVLKAIGVMNLKDYFVHKRGKYIYVNTDFTVDEVE